MNPQPLRYAISDRNIALGVATTEGFVPPADQARRLAADGVPFFQLREKDLPAAELAELARSILGAIAGTGMKLLLNGRADVAAAVGAHGVHLTSSSKELTLSEVHTVYAASRRPAPLVTVSCHSPAEVARRHREPLTAILFGPVFGKTIAGETVTEGLGLAALREACRLAAPVPVFALGGVTEANAASCHEAGAQGIAGIRLFQRLK